MSSECNDCGHPRCYHTSGGCVFEAKKTPESLYQVGLVPPYLFINGGDGCTCDRTYDDIS